jgi:hypothetical protein
VKAIAGIFLLAGAAAAQTAALMPQPVATFFDNSGRPLAGGLVYTCQAGATCPGTTQTTYQDSAATTANSNPVVLDAAGRANIWLTNSPYKIVVKNAVGVTITTTDNVMAGGFSGGGGGGGDAWGVSGTTIYNSTPGTKVCIGSTPCTTANSQLHVRGTGSGTNYILRLEDSAGIPGVNFASSGTSLAAISAESLGLRIRDGSGSSQMLVAAGSTTIQNLGGGASNLTLQGGSAQGSVNYLDVKNNAGSPLAFIDSAGRFAGTLFNATPAAATDVAFQTANSNFSVNGGGDISSNGGINATGANGNDPYKVAGVMIVDASRNAHFNTLTCDSSPCGTGGGGSGSPGGSNTFVQYNNSGAFGGSSNFTWNNTTKLLTVHALDDASAGVAIGTGYIQSKIGFVANAGTAVNYNAIQAPDGGVHARSVTATKYVQLGNNAGAPSVTTNDTFNAGAMYWDTGTSDVQVYNGGGWISLGGGSGSPGGATTNVQYNAAGAFAGSANFTWDNAARLLTVTPATSSDPGIAVANGFIQAAAGFLAPAGTATAYNAIQAPGGGMAARSFTASKYVQVGSGATDPTVSTSDTFNPGALYWNTSSGQMKVYNGSTWGNLSGSGGTPGGSNTAVQFNSSGGFGGSSAFTWSTAGQLLTVTALNASSAGIAVGTGYMQADAGFLATPGTAVNYNSIQAPGGGVYAKSLRAINYTQVGSSAGTPSVTAGDALQPGALYFNTALGQLQVYNGSAWAGVGGGGGGGGVTTAAGTANQVLVNGSTAAAAGAVTLSLPQSIGTTSIPQFAGVIAGGAFNSQATGGSIAFQTANSLFQVDGNGNVSAATQFNVTGGAGSSYKMGGFEVINSVRVFTGTGVNVSGGSVAAGAYVINGGFTVIDASRNASFNNVTIQGTCTGCSAGGVSTVSGGTGVSTSGTTNVTVSIGQSVATSATPLFNGVIASGGTPAFNSTATGATVAFQTSNFNFQVNGNGAISGQQLNIAGQQVINSSRQFVGAGVDVGSNGISAGGYNLAGGLVGQNWNINFPVAFQINGGGAFTQLVVRGGIIVSAFHIFGSLRGFVVIWVLGLLYVAIKRAATIYGERS